MTRFPNGVSSYIVTKGTAARALPQTSGVTAAAVLATISGGRILLQCLMGVVSTVIQTQANATKIQYICTTLASTTDLCATLDITADAVGTSYGISGTVGDAMIEGSGVGGGGLGLQLFQTTPFLLLTGTINANCAASNTGNWQWTFLWTPIDAGAKLVAS